MKDQSISNEASLSRLTAGLAVRAARGGLALAALLAVAACMDITGEEPGGTVPLEEVDFDESLEINLADFDEYPAGLLVREDFPGTDPRASPGSVVEIEVTGWLPSGTTFQGPDDGVTFTVGTPGGGIVGGLHEGINGMQVGAVRTLLLPPYLGYGGAPPAGIPPHSWLVYEVRLLTVDGEDGGPD